MMEAQKLKSVRYSGNLVNASSAFAYNGLILASIVSLNYFFLREMSISQASMTWS